MSNSTTAIDYAEAASASRAEPNVEAAISRDLSEDGCLRVIFGAAVALLAFVFIMQLKHAVIDTGVTSTTAGFFILAILLFFYFGGLLAIGDVYPRARWYIVAVGVALLALLSWQLIASLLPGIGSDDDSSSEGSDSDSAGSTDDNGHSSSSTEWSYTHASTDNPGQPETVPPTTCPLCGKALPGGVGSMCPHCHNLLQGVYREL